MSAVLADKIGSLDIGNRDGALVAQVAAQIFRPDELGKIEAKSKQKIAQVVNVDFPDSIEDARRYIVSWLIQQVRNGNLAAAEKIEQTSYEWVYQDSSGVTPDIVKSLEGIYYTSEQAELAKQLVAKEKLDTVSSISKISSPTS
jgi:hypothetical protein